MMRDDLELRLADLAMHVDFPPTPALADRVVERLRPARAARSRLHLVLVLAAALLIVAVAAAVGLGVRGVRLSPSTGSVPPVPSDIVGERALGQPMSLDAAGGVLGFAPRLPALETLGPPDDIFVLEPPRGGALTLVWRDAAGGIALLITELRADIGPDSFEKLIAEGVDVQATEVDGEPAWWVGGGQHPFFYRDASGAVVHETLRLAEPTLIWEEDGLTLRVEGAPDIGEARAIGASLR